VSLFTAVFNAKLRYTEYPVVSFRISERDVAAIGTHSTRVCASVCAVWCCPLAVECCSEASVSLLRLERACRVPCLRQT
jgi:hypothetical protein